MIKNISYDDLKFDRVPVTSYTLKGFPFQKWIDTGMPRIPDGMLNSVFFLYKTREEAEGGINPGGTGFIVEVTYDIDVGNCICVIRHFYAVTNWHVAKKDCYSVIRINSNDGSTDVFEFDPSDWHSDLTYDDVAIVRVDFDWKNHSVSAIPIELLLPVEDLVNKHNIGLGDDVFMLGTFVDLDTKARNHPTARFGCISSMPYPIGNESDNLLRDTYLLDMRSRGGFSGSPVFVYRTPGSNLEHILNNHKPGVLVNFDMKPKFFLLGIHRGQFNEEMKIKGGNYDVIGKSGMTLVVPAWRVFELLANHEDIIKDRNKSEGLQIEQCLKHPPQMISDESSDTGHSSTTHKEDFNTLLDAAVRGKQ